MNINQPADVIVNGIPYKLVMNEMLRLLHPRTPKTNEVWSLTFNTQTGQSELITINATEAWRANTDEAKT